MMRPINLRMKNFTAYKDVSLNLDSLIRSRLFLVRGNTGAGKTSIFRAIWIALYGVGSGDASLEKWRANKEEDSIVELEFEAKGHRYKVVRKFTKRGNLRSHLYAIDPQTGKKTSIASKQREVNDKIQSLIGLDGNQFKQVVMLPQDEFLNFLESKRAERAQLLRSLFDIHIYERITSEAKQLKDSMKQELERMDRMIESELERVGVESEEELENRLKNAVELQAKLEANLKNMDERRKNLLAAIAAEQERMRLLEVAKQLEARLGELDSQKEEIEHLRQEIDSAKRAMPVLQAYNVHSKHRKHLDDLNEKLDENGSLLEEAIKKLAVLDEESSRIEQIRNQLPSMLSRLSQLDASIEQAHRLNQIISTQKELNDQIQSAEENLRAVQSRLDAVAEEMEHSALQIEELEQSEQKLSKEVANKGELIREIAIWERLRELLSSKKKLEEAKVALMEQIEQANQQIASMESERKELERQIESIGFAKLAIHLKDGQPCPVCGSVHHPSPARMPDGADSLHERLEVLNERLEQLKRQEHTKRGELNQIQSLFAETLTAIDSLQPKLGLELDEVEARLRELDKRMREIESKEAELKRVEAELSSMRKKMDSLQRRERGIRKELTAMEVEVSAMRQQYKHMEEIAAELSKQLDGKDAEKILKERNELAAKIEQNKQAISVFEGEYEQSASLQSRLRGIVDTLREERKKAEMAVSESIEELKARVANSKFSSIEEALGYALTEAELETKTARLSRFETEYSDIESRLKQVREDLTSRFGDEPDRESSLVEMKEVLNSLEEEIEKVSTRLRETSVGFEGMKSSLERIEQLRQNRKELADEQAFVEYFHGVISATNSETNPRHIALDDFVLHAFLERIVFHANRFFRIMTRGDFELETNIYDRFSKTNIHAGLGIRVYDKLRGVPREISTLSGGEKFIAALSLALGLSQTVQSSSGKSSEMSVLFIDEGFGRLDPDSLSIVMDQISTLRNLDRAVGIISHVEALADYMDTVVEVRKDADGYASIRVRGI